MRELRVNILECYDKFQLVALGCSLYQKKIGEIVIPKEGMMRDIVTKFPDLPKLFGSAIGKYGGCPSIVFSVPKTTKPTKIMSFPITPTSLRVESPEDVVIARLAKRFKPFTLLPGWLLRPRMDMIEFSCIKLAEIIKYYKLTDVALVIDTLGLGEGDEKYYDIVRDMFLRYFGDLPVNLCTSPDHPKVGAAPNKNTEQEVTQSVIASTYTEDTSEEEIF
jgi:hypothetical protein